MNPMTDMFDFTKNFEQFTKFAARTSPTPARSRRFNDMAAKYRAVAIEALQQERRADDRLDDGRRQRRDDPPDGRNPADRLREKSR